MWEIGRGYSSLEKLYDFLNMQPPVNKNVFCEIQCKIKTAYEEERMNNIKSELNDREEEGTAEVTVSCDGTCQ